MSVVKKGDRNELCQCGSGKKYKKCCLQNARSSVKFQIKPLYAYILLAITCIIALVIRVTPVTQTPETYRNGIGAFGDSFLYHVIGYNLYTGHGFSRTMTNEAFGYKGEGKKITYEPQITRGPGYPFFISLVYKFWGNKDDMSAPQTVHKYWDKLRIIQCVLDTGTCILVFFITRAIFSGSYFPALIAAVLYCFSFYNIYYTRAVLCETLTTFLLTASLLFCILGIKLERTYLWALSGIIFGAVVLTRQEYVLFPGVILAYFLFKDRQHILRSLIKPLLFTMLAAAVVVPWTIRNYCVFKKFIPVAVGEFGMNLFWATCETNDNWKGWSELPGDAFDSKEEKDKAQKLFNHNQDLFGHGGIDCIDSDNALKDLGIERIKRHPLDCIQRWVMKIPRLWYQFYVPMYREREASGGFFIFYFIFALIAFFTSLKEERALMAVLGLLFFYLNLILIPLHVEPRFGVPLMPVIICMASLGIWKCLGKLFSN